jgi:hypothetical protein
MCSGQPPQEGEKIMNEKMFEFAVRNKLRFPFKGSIATEDLFDLSVKDLDSIFKTLNAQVKQAAEESLLDTKSKEDETLDVQIEIIKYIVGVKQFEAEIQKQAVSKRQEKQKILAILKDKKDESLKNMTPEQLQEMLDRLGD